jgi:molecular chaperone HscB
MDPFATLGLPRSYEIDMQELESNYRALQKAMHPDKHVGTSASQRRLSLEHAAQINDAYRVLKDELRRAEALLGLYGAKNGEGEAADQEFLVEMLELREALGEAKDARDLASVRALSGQVERQRARAQRELTQVFAELGRRADGAETGRAAALVSQLKYFRRFLDEVAAIEEEVLR